MARHGRGFPIKPHLSKLIAMSAWSQSFSEEVTLVDQTMTSAFVYVKTLLESVTVTDTITRAMTRSLDEAVTLVDSIVKGIGRSLSETVTLVVSLGQSRARSFYESITVTDSIKKYLNGIQIADWRKRTPPSSSWTPRDQP